MKLILFIILILGITLSSCKEDKKTTKQTIYISGKLISTDFKTIYLKKIDNFNYLTNDYILDSTTISSDGKFEFELDYLPSNLLTLSTKNYQPSTYIVLRQHPDKYYYGGCAKFFASEPTFYVKENDSVNLEWFDNKILDSIIYKTDLAKNQNIMRNYYSNIMNNVAGHLDRENKLDYQIAWYNVLKDQKKDLSSINISKINIVDSFENYMYSEIILYNLNGYLNWFEDMYPEEVNTAIKGQNESDLYNQIFAKYSNHLWNSDSFEYYKFTERFVAYKMNIKNKSFKTYYKPTMEKKDLAKKVLTKKNKERYIKIIEKQINNVL